MNGFERIDAALKGQWPDIRPIMLHNFMHAAREAGFTMKQYYSNPENAAKAHIQALEKYGLDGVLFDIDTAVLASAVGVPVDFPEDEPARVHQACLETIEDVESLGEIDVSIDPRVQIAVEGVRILKKQLGNEFFIRANADQAPFSLASMMRTPANWMLDVIMNPELSHKLLKWCTVACKQFVKLLADEGAHMISNGDSPAGPEMISPDQYKEFALPYEKEIVDYAHELKQHYLIHICGNTELILDQMLTLGADAVELDYKTDVNKIHTLYKDNITLFGTIDPSGVLALGSVQDVETKTKELLALYADSPRLVMNAGCAIPPTAPEENIKKLVEVTRNADFLVG